MRRKSKRESLDVIWNVPDELWLVIEPILLEDAPPKPIGRSRVNWRNALDGILFRMRSGCQWNKLPKEFGDDSSIHRWFQRWNRNGVMEQIWGMLVEHCTALGGVDWKWQSADGAMGKARFGGEKVGPNPTDRAKPGTKRSVLTDAQGGPLGVVIDGANRHDAKLLKSTIESIVVERPDPETHEQHLCLDKGYDNPSGREAACEAGYTPHIRRIGEDVTASRQKKAKPRRWVVERTMAWLSKCRAILVRYDKNWFNYLGLIQFACALLWYRRAYRIGAV